MLMEGGVPILRALDMVEALCERRKDARMIATVHQRIREGDYLSGALRAFGMGYTPRMYECVRCAEHSGDPNELTVALRLIVGDVCVRPSQSTSASVVEQKPFFRIFEE